MSAGQGVRVSVEGEVVLVDIHSRVWVGVSHLVFRSGHYSVHSQGEDEARHGASLDQALFMVWVMISPLSSLHVSSCPALKSTAHHFHTFLSEETSLLMTCPMAKAWTSPFCLVAGTIRAARYVPKISVGTSAVASLQKASHTQSHKSPSNSVIHVQCSYLPPLSPVALLEGENLMASRSWQRKLCLRFGLGIEFGPVSLDVGSGSHSADALDQLACSPPVPVFHG